MSLKAYQEMALDRYEAFLHAYLAAQEATPGTRQASREAFEASTLRDFGLRVPYHAPPALADADIPVVCLRIPTGGGKTLLATKVVDLVNTHYRKQQHGLVLWVVPTTQIYNQTLRALKDRDHPYRQMLDVASAGRTLVLEKTSGFSPSDVAENLCVLLLMLPSANRETKEQLRMFRDSGGYDRFFPADDDIAGVAAIYPEPDHQAETGTIRTHVRLSGRDVFGAHVMAFNPISGAMIAGFVLEDGEASITGLSPGPYVLRVEPVDDDDVGSYFDEPDVDLAFKNTFIDRLIYVQRGATAGPVEISLEAK